MNTFDHEQYDDVGALLRQAKLELPHDRKVRILDSLRDPDVIPIHLKTTRKSLGFLPTHVGPWLAAIPAVVVVGVFMAGLQNHWFHTSQPASPSNQSVNSNRKTRPFDYQALLGFQPMLPTQNFKSDHVSSYVFQYVNPALGGIGPLLMDTWGNDDIAFEADYYPRSGSGKPFAVMETATNSSAPPHVGIHWNTVDKNGTTFYESNLPDYGTTVAMIKNGVLDVAYTYNSHGLTTSQLEQVLQSLTVTVNSAPDSILTSTYGFAKAPAAVPFTALVPKTLPFKWSTRAAAAVNVKAVIGKAANQPMGRLTLTYQHGKTQVKIVEGVSLKFSNPNIMKAANGVRVTLTDGHQAVFVDGGSAVSRVDGGSSNRKLVTWNTKSGINIVIVGSPDLTENDLLRVANSLVAVKSR